MNVQDKNTPKICKGWLFFWYSALVPKIISVRKSPEAAILGRLSANTIILTPGRLTTFLQWCFEI